MTIESQLKTAGMPDYVAEALGNEFANEPGFMEGLEQVTQVMNDGKLPSQQAFPPPGEPWKSIYVGFLSNGSNIDSSFLQSVSVYPFEIGNAITTAVSFTIDFIRQKRAQSGKRKRHKTNEYLQVLAGLGYSFRLNDLDDKIEVDGKPISDPLAAKIRSQMRDKGFPYTNVMEDAYLAYAYDNRYHPIKDYFRALSYDGKQHIAEMTRHFGDRDGVFPMWIRRWMIATVARVYTGIHHPMLILDGPQGIGKSYWTRWLCPLSDFFIESPIRPDDKDDWIRLASKWIWEVAELGSTTRRADREALKHFISAEKVTVRKAYGRHDLEKPALSSFIGTVNNEIGLLSDPTGHRRFMAIHLEDVNWSYTSLDIDALWSEAVAAYLDGEHWQLDKAEQKRAKEINARYETEDPLEGMVKQLFIIDPKSLNWLPSAVIIDHLQGAGLKGNTRSNSMMLASTMTRLGLERKRDLNAQGQRVWGYIGISFAQVLGIP